MESLKTFRDDITIDKYTLDCLIRGFTTSALVEYIDAQRKATIKSIAELETTKHFGVDKKGKPLTIGDLNVIANEIDEEWQYAERTFGGAMVEFENDVNVAIDKAIEKKNKRAK